MEESSWRNRIRFWRRNWRKRSQRRKQEELWSCCWMQRRKTIRKGKMLFGVSGAATRGGREAGATTRGAITTSRRRMRVHQSLFFGDPQKKRLKKNAAHACVSRK